MYKKLILMVGAFITINGALSQPAPSSGKKEDKVQFSIKCSSAFTQGNWNVWVIASGKAAYVESQFGREEPEYYKATWLFTNSMVHRYAKKDDSNYFWQIDRNGQQMYHNKDNYGHSLKPCQLLDFSQTDFERLKGQASEYEKNHLPATKAINKPKI